MDKVCDERVKQLAVEPIVIRLQYIDQGWPGKMFMHHSCHDVS